MNFKTDLSLRDVVTAPIPVSEKIAVLNAVKEKLHDQLEWLKDPTTGSAGIEGIELSSRIDTIDIFLNRYVLLNNK